MTGRDPSEPSRRDRLAAVLSPEIIAVGLILLLIAGGLLSVSAGGQPAPGATPSPVTTPSAASVPSGNPPTTAPSPTLVPSNALPTAAPTVRATPTPTPVPSSAPTAVAWAGTARMVLIAEERLIEQREALRADLAANPKVSDDLARLVRATNSNIQVALTSISALGETDAPAGLVARLRETHEAALTAGKKNLAIALRDVKAYKKGSTEFVVALEPLDGLVRELAAAAGVPDPLPSVAASASPGSSPTASAP